MNLKQYLKRNRKELPRVVLHKFFPEEWRPVLLTGENVEASENNTFRFLNRLYPDFMAHKKTFKEIKEIDA